MARPPRQATASPGLTAGQSAYVLDRLIAERRISPGEVNRILSEMGREISDLELKLQRLREAHGGAAAPASARRGPGRPAGRPPAIAAAAAAKGGAKPGRKRRRAITPQQAASRVLQGRYLALVRQFPAGRRPQFAKIAKDKGREAAIREMQESLKK